MKPNTVGGLNSFMKEMLPVAERLANLVSPRRVYSIAKRITLYHRIQGSPGLVSVVEDLESFILEYSPDIVETGYFAYTGKVGPEWLGLPASWSVFDAQVEASNGFYTNLVRHPTLVAAHSPPSDGWVSGEVVVVEDPLDPSGYEKFKDKIIILKNNYRVGYRLAAEAGVKAVILAKKTKNMEAYPYIGLFLTSKEAEKYTTPALSMPSEIAESLKGKTLKIKIDADLKGPGRLPVLVAWIGDKNSDGPIITGHICHPMPGANDNASGASASLEAFLALAEAIDKNLIPTPEATIRLILMPEFTGTILGLEGWMKKHRGPVFNLDMVGASSHIGVEEAKPYTPPVSNPLREAFNHYIAAVSIAGGKPRASYYMFGSDHDAYLAYNRSSIIVNQWPDPYYHTDMDDATNLDPERLTSIALEAAIAAFTTATRIEPPRQLADEAIRRIIYDLALNHARRKDEIASRLASFYAARRLGIEELAPPPMGWRPHLSGSLEVTGPRMFLSTTQIAQFNLDRAIELEKHLRELSLNTSLVHGEIVFYALRREDLGIVETLTTAVYGSSSGSKLGELIEVLESAKIVRVRG